MKLKSGRWRRALAGGALIASLGLVSCGGGQQVQAFSPNRVIAFGDESSVIDDSSSTANGRKYSVNATVSATDPTLVCSAFPLWIQATASAYNLVFPQCNNAATPVASPASRIRATPNAKVADLAAQIDAQAAESAYTTRDLAMVLIGQNDVLAAYVQFPSVPETQLIANLENAGKALGEQVNRLAATGAKVLIATIADVGLTPFAADQKKNNTDTDRAALLSRLTARFNASMRATIINDGRMIGLILFDEYTQTVYRIVNAGGFTNVLDAVCDPAKAPTILDCTSLTLVANGNATTYLWGDATHLSAGGQLALGTLARQRASNNPF